MPLKVYFLDDEVDILEIFEDTYASENVQIRTFSDPQQAINEIKINRPDLLFIDYRLPNTNGDEVALQLDDSIPKVLISADYNLTPKAKFVACLIKPYKKNDILELIKRYSK
ncbi:MAG: response regulator [Bacteriovoracaceae bacterium]